MSHDFNAELHARPSIYFTGPAYVEHVALMPERPTEHLREGGPSSIELEGAEGEARTRVEHHTEFVTVTRVTQIKEPVTDWPASRLTVHDFTKITGIGSARLVSRVGIIVLGSAPEELGPFIAQLGFKDSAASHIGGGSAHVCSDFRVGRDNTSRVLLFNRDLNSYRLGRMVRRIYEIETYRSMALLGLPQARRLGPLLDRFDAKLIELTERNLKTAPGEHKDLLEDISVLSAQVISATAETRHRFGATTAYAKIVEERIAELREEHFPGFQRFGVFVVRRFKPAIRTCEATSLRLDQLSRATMHLIDLLQTRIQFEIEYQNASQIKAMADRTAVQVKIQRAVEGFSIIAISYYLLGILKVVVEASEHAGVHIDPAVMLISIPVVLTAVALLIFRVKHALKHES
ncbi:DUF3422 domain-containing protein [Rhizobium calliandrae]|uniref:DUF3422 domain-containing protein n=1 Tax=Rhizobium calliandrae TaxID=1312182 RepID=A0ABT7KM49_9HYPH|nr:DUF3422 domain-containing protein [Rhizobium calliandrae]MDL2409008.1 DUF3422 domain-containing protein [Rhizobium calliandrae]